MANMLQNFRKALGFKKIMVHQILSVREVYHTWPAAYMYFTLHCCRLRHFGAQTKPHHSPGTVGAMQM